MVVTLAICALTAFAAVVDDCTVVRVTACIQEQDSRDFGYCISGPGPVSPNELLKALQGATVIKVDFHETYPGGCDDAVRAECSRAPGTGPQPEDTLCAWEWGESGEQLSVNATCSHDAIPHGCYIFDLDGDLDLDLRDFAAFQNSYPLTDGRPYLGGDYPGQP